MKNTFSAIGSVLLRVGVIYLVEAVYAIQYIFEDTFAWPLEILFLCFCVCVMLALLRLESKVAFYLPNPRPFSAVMSVIDFGFALFFLILFCGIGNPVWGKAWDGVVAQIILIILRSCHLYPQNNP